MGFRFRKSVRILPGVRINLGGRRGPSVTVGGRGASVNIGPRGSYMNAGIPGTGLSMRERIDGPDSGTRTPPQQPALPTAGGTAGNGSLLPYALVLIVGVVLGAIFFG